MRLLTQQDAKTLPRRPTPAGAGARVVRPANSPYLPNLSTGHRRYELPLGVWDIPRTLDHGPWSFGIPHFTICLREAHLLLPLGLIPALLLNSEFFRSSVFGYRTSTSALSILSSIGASPSAPYVYNLRIELGHWTFLGHWSLDIGHLRFTTPHSASARRIFFCPLDLCQPCCPIRTSFGPRFSVIGFRHSHPHNPVG